MASQPFQHSSGPKRPRLSLKINTCSSSVPSRPVKGFHVDPTDRTACNTLSNVYATAIERSTPVQAEPLTAINTLQSFSLKTPAEPRGPRLKIKTPYVAAFPQTPTTETSGSPPQKMDIAFPSTMTPTPPMSAGAVDSTTSSAFPFSPRDVSSNTRAYGVTSPCSPVEPLLSRRYTAAYTTGAPAPYTHPHSLHSILRNSPLPPRTAIPASPRRQSLRLQEKAAKRVGYNNPLTQTIITNKYTKSHIDLLVEEASPASPSFSPIGGGGGERAATINLKQAFSPNEIENGGQTPGPFEDMRRKLAALSGGAAASPSSLSPSETGGIRKRKRKEKKRQWVWTIGVADEEEEDDERVGGAIAASRAEAASASVSASSARVRGTGTGTGTGSTTKAPRDDGEVGRALCEAVVPDIQMVPDTPTASIEGSSADSAIDIDMSDASSVVSEDLQGLPVGPAASLAAELDVKTPTAASCRAYFCNGYNKRKRDTPIPELAEAQDTHVSVDS
ncbi:uncharacterized protein TRIREDRAFT_102743 [Trichoderma reesei QM6a]|uniref:Predicted protein n=1 Tax=Hypocrea jecorina (strain QM6a) TaxID=431241 RepID=G0R855_HYPJQ|nr:uncharacterized protein TRIREDRAFT_102743 [Trichoderma reesei QM6a]EGR52297.1 predicted protein [Trichoderma reesei QM6a]